MKKNIIISSIALLFTSSALSQDFSFINNFYTKEHWSGNFNLGIDYNDTRTVESTLFNLSSNLNYKFKDNIIRFNAFKEYGKANSLKSRDQENISLRYVRKSVIEENDLETYIQYQNNFFSNLKNRNIAGIGTRGVTETYGLYQHDIRSNYYVGLLREKDESFDDLIKKASRFDTFLEIEFLIDKDARKKVFSRIDYKPKMDEFKDYRFYFLAGAEFFITQNIILGTNYSLNYQSRAFNINQKFSNKSLKTYIRYEF